MIVLCVRLSVARDGLLAVEAGQPVEAEQRGEGEGGVEQPQSAGARHGPASPAHMGSGQILSATTLQHQHLAWRLNRYIQILCNQILKHKENKRSIDNVCSCESRL